MQSGEFLKPEASNLLLNMSSMLLNGNYIMQHDGSFKEDNTFLEAF
jgi:hypothetical protein